MFNSRYSEPELKQWQDACTADTCAGSDAARHTGARALMAKGQAEKKQSRTGAATMQTQKPKQQDWASECLFDCYNG